MKLISIASGRRVERDGRRPRGLGAVRSMKEWKRAHREEKQATLTGLPAPVDYRTAILRALLPFAVR
jgi:hypothetical protein